MRNSPAVPNRDADGPTFSVTAMIGAPDTEPPEGPRRRHPELADMLDARGRRAGVQRQQKRMEPVACAFRDTVHRAVTIVRDPPLQSKSGRFLQDEITE